MIAALLSGSFARAGVDSASQASAKISGDGIFSDAFDSGWTGASNVRLEVPGELTLTGRLFLPPQWSSETPVLVLAHGCKGMWSFGEPWPDTPDAVAQSAIERWGLELSRRGYVALAIDSFTPRTPVGVSPAAYQNQCNGDAFEGSVDPYTTRVRDIDIGLGWIRYRLGIPGTSRIAAIGWSEGAESVLVRAAETGREQDTSLYAEGADAPGALSAAVVFYPGCGANLGFDLDPFVDGSDSFWRPHRDLRMNHASRDPLSANCAGRVETAQSVYGAQPQTGHWVDWTLYPDASHSFDSNGSTDWPSAACEPGGMDGSPDECAQRAADIDSLAFLSARLQQ